MPDYDGHQHSGAGTKASKSAFVRSLERRGGHTGKERSLTVMFFISSNKEATFTVACFGWLSTRKIDPKRKSKISREKRHPLKNK